ncbi:YdcF family protein [Neptunicoccus sediminis]|uniref:YdcF family protein n=1 Tax=Neptunicoccus sediminis TaxID=1892596 RepID=UPI0008461B5D|nr:YdcF family protein [Neptunicoccus sediminis]
MALLAIFRRVLAVLLSIYLLTVVFVTGFATLQPLWEPAMPEADMIVVLGGGMSAEGRLHRSTTVRVDRGVALYQAGAAPQILFTGGALVAGAPAAGRQMAQRAREQGVPQAAILTETRSHSTLQNALFSRADWQAAAHIILVTEGFHLPRSWASFKAFGAKQITLVHARRFRGDSVIGGVKMVLRESLAYWFNGARYLIWQAAGLSGLARADRDALLY